MTTTQTTPATIQILHTTAKGAALVTDGNLVAWVKPNYLRENGTLTPAGERALAESALTFEQYQKTGTNPTIAGNQVKRWSPNPELIRYYFTDNSYVQYSVKDAEPVGYYERHRACKGERYAKVFVSAVGELASRLIAEMEDHFTSMANMITSKSVSAVIVKH